MTEPRRTQPARTEPIRIANCSGFYGDRLSAAAEMVDGGPVDALTGDWLAELTMLILARTQAKRPGSGYARTFVAQMEQVMGACVDRGIKVVSNAGGLDVRNCAEAVAEVADKLGLSPTIAYVEGDSLLGRVDELREAGVDLVNFETGEPLARSDYISANAYLGCWGIVEALDAGADIVVTGRTTDAAVVCGPAAWHHGWARHDFDALAGAVVAGHVIECGTQATGGNYSFFTEIPGLERAGFPIAEVASDGSSVIAKHPGSGGAVTTGTVTSQLLYEIDAPAYLGPDVTARFDTVALEQVAADRVRISGVKGEPPPAALKVSMNSWGGYRSDIAVALTGLDIEAKADLVQRAFWEAVPVGPDDFVAVSASLVRTDHADPPSNEAATAVWQLTVKDPDERKCKALSAGLNELALATIPGFYGLGRSGIAKPFGVHTSALVPASLVPQYVTVLGGPRTVVDSALPAGGDAAEPEDASAGEDAAADARGFADSQQQTESSAADTGPTRRLPLGTIIGTRSGDKGGNANLGLFARSQAGYAWLKGLMTVDKLRELLPEAATLEVDRYELANIGSLNFVIHGLLQEGVAASTRQDAQAKSLGEWLRARHVDIPVALLEADSPGRLR